MKTVRRVLSNFEKPGNQYFPTVLTVIFCWLMLSNGHIVHQKQLAAALYSDPQGCFWHSQDLLAGFKGKGMDAESEWVQQGPGWATMTEQ